MRALQKAKQQKQDKKDAEVLLSTALAAYSDGRHADAQALCTRVLESLPNSFNALHLAGMSELETGNLSGAETRLKRALNIEPRSAEVHSNLGVVLFQMKRFEEARKSYERAIALKPNYPTALNNLGNTLLRLKLIEDAVARYSQAIKLKPDYADAYLNLGMALLILNQEERADQSFERALSFRLGYLEAKVGKGMVQANLRHFDAALSIFNSTLKLRPAFAEALVYRGHVQMRMHRLDSAKQDFEAALSINPTLDSAWLRQAEVCLLSNDLAQAINACQTALKFDPNSETGLTIMANCLAKQGDIVKAIEYYDRAISLKPDSKQAITSKMFALDFLPGADFTTHQAARKYWWEAIGSKIQRLPPQVSDRDPDRRLVIGYVSSDFRDHSVAIAFRPIIRNHNRDEFKIILYSCSHERDAVTIEFQTMADRWIDASQLSDDELANRIQSDEVDILVDLSGYSAGNRLEVLARKPASIQVTAWGHPTGTGLPSVDYLFADPTAIPEWARDLFSEKVHDLPCVITLEPITQPKPATLPMSRNGYVTFGVFNRVDKISDPAMAVWCELLAETPQSKIIIKNGALDDLFLRERLIARFVQKGLSRDRVQCLGSTTRHEHLHAFGEVDISLDPFPQNGGVSTWESLQMGVPVIAKLGNNLSSRVAGAIIKSIGLDGWVVEDDRQYIAAAKRFASMPHHLETLRVELPTIIAGSQAGNPKYYVQHVEKAYRQFWRLYCGRKITG
jgi:pentatricopeptide repeat protein